MVHERGTVPEMRTGKGNQITRRKRTPVPFCPPQIPYDLSWDAKQGNTNSIRVLQPNILIHRQHAKREDRPLKTSGHGLFNIFLCTRHILLYFSILLHSFNTEYLFFCPSM
jgi:hypothetical protein